MKGKAEGQRRKFEGGKMKIEEGTLSNYLVMIILRFT
jgi:hypothetical protein